MPTPAPAPTKTPTPTKTPEPSPEPERDPGLTPSRVCPQQRREVVSPDCPV